MGFTNTKFDTELKKDLKFFDLGLLEAVGSFSNLFSEVLQPKGVVPPARPSHRKTLGEATWPACKEAKQVPQRGVFQS